MESSKVSSLASSFVMVENSDGKPAAQPQHPSTSDSYTPGTGHSYAHDWSEKSTGGLRIQGRHFVDKWGRVCQLRGVNLSGNCKTPVNDDHDGFPESPSITEVTFVGRPFPIEEAHEHLARLQRWGLTFVRFLVTWEAIEHAGPGIYDTDYLNYLHEVLSLFPAYGIKVYISMHQDVWSRYTGGSGAPAWTLTSIGLSIPHLEQASAAWLRGVKGGGHTEDERGLWPTGYQKLAAGSVNTVFWGGKVFAPKLQIEAGDAQTWLQERFLCAWEVLVRAVGSCEAVGGFQMMNEPHRGYIDVPSLHGFDYNTDLHLGAIPSALQSFALGAGHTTSDIPVYTRSFPMPTRCTSYTTLRPSQSVWLPDGPTRGRCLWEIHGVWALDKTKPIALRENYFKKNPQTGVKFDWYKDSYWPLLKLWAKRVRAVEGCERKWVFLEGIPNELCPEMWTDDSEEKEIENMVFAPHWYDLYALFNKSFGRLSVNVQALSRGTPFYKAFYWGQQSARECYALQIRNIVEAGYKNLREIPVIIGEAGVPMDMNKGQSFGSGRWEWQEKMMDALMTAFDRSLVGFNLWNYNPNNDDKAGDDWNGENFSWFSNGRARRIAKSDATSLQVDVSLDDGGRILPSIVRPYPAKVAGIPLRFDYEMNTGSFSLTWVTPLTCDNDTSLRSPLSPAVSVSNPPRVTTDPLACRESEIFVPSFLTRSRKLIVRGVEAKDWRYDESRQTLFILNSSADQGVARTVEVSLDPPLKMRWKMHTHWTSFGTAYLSVVLLILATFYYWILPGI